MKLVLVGLVAVLLACGNDALQTRASPDWLNALIQYQQAAPVANPPAYIARYNYKGQTVYYLPPRCCDVWSTLYADDGAILCHPDGGLAGGGDGRCADFLAQRTNEQIIWRDSRS